MAHGSGIPILQMGDREVHSDFQPRSGLGLLANKVLL